MTAYLLAAGLSGATVDEFVGWCQNDLDTEATAILRRYPQYVAVRRTLQQAQAVVEETRSGIWETLRDAIACLTDPDVADSALPRPDPTCCPLSPPAADISPHGACGQPPGRR